MSERYVAAVDQGTASSRCLIFDDRSRVVSVSQIEHRAPLPPARATSSTTRRRSGATSSRWSRGRSPRSTSPSRDLVGLGLTNQRETTVLWDRATGEPVHNAITWQDMRTDHLVRELGGDAGADRFRDRCGLPLATYFSGPKIRWLLDHIDGLRERAEAGEVVFGTIDSWLIWKLTGRHVTDVTNAGRTMLMDLRTLDWDDVLLDAMGVPRAMLPEIRPSMEVYGEAGGEAGRAAGRGGARRPARRAVRPDLLRPGRHEVHVRHGLLPAHEHGARARALGQRPADHGRLQGRRRAGDLRARGLDRGHGRAGAVVPRQARADRQRVGDRDARALRRRQRRLLLRPRLLRPVRAALAQRRARRDRRAHGLHLQGAPRARRARGDLVADPRGRRRDELRRGDDAHLAARSTAA